MSLRTPRHVDDRPAGRGSVASFANRRVCTRMPLARGHRRIRRTPAARPEGHSSHRLPDELLGLRSLAGEPLLPTVEGPPVDTEDPGRLALAALRGLEDRLDVEIREVVKREPLLPRERDDHVFEAAVDPHRIVRDEDVAGADLASVGERDAALDAVLELSGIPLPGSTLQLLHRLLGELVGEVS